MLLGNTTLEAEIVGEAVGLRNPPAALLGLLGDVEDPALLDSSAFHPQYGRFSILACSPMEVLTLRDGVLRDRAGDVLGAGSDEAIWSALGEALSAVRVSQPATGGYVPGWIGYVGYEVGRHIERLPAAAVRDTRLPDLRLAFYDALLVYDSVEGRASLVELRFARPPRGAGRAGAILRDVIRRAADIPRQPPPEPAERASAAVRPSIEDARPNFTPSEYRRAVQRCIDYIAAGDIFQVNLSQRFEVETDLDPLRIYRTLRRRNPAWYACYLDFREAGARCAVLSSSPELFLRVRGRRVVTRPIKGTRPRVGRPEVDAAAKADLLASAKDNAELAMIVDLLRNDLGRLCEYGTIRVTEPRALETHPTVFHLVGTVEGVLREGVGPAEMLKATFPGGSITGAPKIRAMEIIDELEGLARCVYTGCIGIVGVDGSCEWNIAIRTILCDGGRVLLQVGGGIVADSDPLDEYYETLHKARAMLEAIAEARSSQPVPP
jgi:para-aminobenzoate synthetase component 1